MVQSQSSPAAAFPRILTDRQVADTLGVTVAWVRSYAKQLPGFIRIGSHYRFHRDLIVAWLGSLDRLLEAEEIAAYLQVSENWVYANADNIIGVLRLGRYVRFRAAVVEGVVTDEGLSGPHVIQ